MSIAPYTKIDSPLQDNVVTYGKAFNSRSRRNKEITVAKKVEQLIYEALSVKVSHTNVSKESETKLKWYIIDHNGF